VGYAVASPETVAALAGHLPPWPVTTLAANALAEALADGDYARATLTRNAACRARLTADLTGFGRRVFPSSANFLLVELPPGCQAAQIQRSLLETSRILVRVCDSFEGLTPGRYIRVAVRSDEDNARLVSGLAATAPGLPGSS
jgi:histidinol-phosphate/aromatic aminotransferase/cobyric acid decarboxylase-like protein